MCRRGLADRTEICSGLCVATGVDCVVRRDVDVTARDVGDSVVGSEVVVIRSTAAKPQLALSTVIVGGV